MVDRDRMFFLSVDLKLQMLTERLLLEIVANDIHDL